MSRVRPPVIAIGIDAASPALLEQWMADGTLPNLKALVARGSSGRLGGVDGFFVGSTWPSLYTGTSPAQHGVHYQLQIRPGSYELHQVADAGFVHGETLWRALSNEGRRVAILDVPLSRLDSVNGVHVVEWGGHDSLFGFRTHPADLAAQLISRHGPHPQPAACDGERHTAAEFGAFLDRLALGVDRKTQLTLGIMEREPWDFVMQVFTEAHCTGHQCWHLHDPLHPAHDVRVTAELGDPLRRIYARIDEAVGAIVAHAAGARVVVFSAHGMGHWYGAQFLLPGILHRLGVTQPLARTAPRESPLMRVAASGWRLMPESLKRPIRRARAQLGAGEASSAGATPRIDADVVRSRCFPLNNGQAVGGIRLNLRGREPHGLLEPGAPADDFCRALAADLLAIRDERTGRQLISRVMRTNELYSGSRVDELPDLLVAWNDELATGTSALADGNGARVRASSPKIGVVEGVNQYGRTGEHRPGGWFVAAGEGIPHRLLPRECSLLDLAPTLAALAGATMPRAQGNAIPLLVEFGET